MKNNRTRFVASVFLNIVLLIGCSIFAFNFMNSYIHGAYNHDELLILTKNISAQELLLKTLIQGYSKEKTVAIIKKGIEKSGDQKMNLQIHDDFLIFNETKIIFENGVVKDVVYVRSPETEQFEYLMRFTIEEKYHANNKPTNSNPATQLPMLSNDWISE